MTTRPEVLHDIAQVQRELRHQAGLQSWPAVDAGELVRLQPWRPVADIVFDMVAIALALALAGGVGMAAWPVTLLVLGNRQRALGNLLHDGSHRNLSRHRAVNDGLAAVLLAPLLFLDLGRYRAVHFRHHRDLGDAHGDPDLMPIPAAKARHWWQAVVQQVFVWPTWLGSAFGHLVDGKLPRPRKVRIVAWWLALLLALGALLGPGQALAMIGLWLLARMTVFHVITTLREMCDHHGLQPGGVFSFARDLTAHGVWQRLIHPRNNAYHLTHHLLPAVPYYRLPQAQRVFARLPAYASRAHVCDRYLSGSRAVALDWQTPPAA